jgi:hypothetical protein
MWQQVPVPGATCHSGRPARWIAGLRTGSGVRRVREWDRELRMLGVAFLSYVYAWCLVPDARQRVRET